MDDIDKDGCRHLGPVILGEMAFAAIENKSFDCWTEFKNVVNCRFGLTEEEMI